MVKDQYKHAAHEYDDDYAQDDDLRPVAAATGINTTNDSSPIRTVTRREIVPGTYGPVNVGSQAGDAVWVVIDGSRNAAELREAAHLFNQIAEVLEEQAGQANAA